jgi:hypothetical protein
MRAGTMVREMSTTWKDARAHQDGCAVPHQDRKAVNEEDDASTSDSDDDNDTSEYYDSESHQIEQIDSEDEFVDAEFEELVSSEGPQEMLQLMLQEQADGTMTEEIMDGDDYADWISTTRNLVVCNQSLCNWHATGCRLQLSRSCLQL